MLVLVGCSSEQSTRPTPQETVSSSFQDNSSDSSLIFGSESALQDSLVSDSAYDAMTALLLERARRHYVRAVNAEQDGDSTRSASEFESAIAFLNELGYYPNIENNCDFNDLSRSVVEDYEKYIAKIDSLGPQASIFALRNKLNQVDEANTSLDQDVPKQVIKTLTVPLVINGHVEQNIRYLQERGRGHFEHWLYLSGKYVPIMKATFRKEGVPEELVYLSMIESGLNPVARSWAKAVGLWQFVKGTGRLYGLGGNFWYDERRDFEKATTAAARHLKDLYAEFGDWYLVLAAYNSGAGRVHHAIHRSKSTDFWSMRPRLPRETRNYVPQYIAAAVMAIDPKTYGFEVEPSAPLHFDVVSVDDCVDFTVLAKCAGTDVETLRELNPELLQWCTPPGTKGYQLRIPSGAKSSFAENYAKIPDDQKRDWLVVTVKKGQTLGTISKKYNIPSALLAEVNRLNPRRRISAGKSLLIPVSLSSATFAVNPVDDDQPVRSRRTAGTAGKDKLSYRVKKGDTIGGIAKLYHVRASDLRSWNGIPYGRQIKAGSLVVLWEPKERAESYRSLDSTREPVQPQVAAADASQKDSSSIKKALSYIVRRGDTLHGIASSFGVTIQNLRTWNNIRGTKIHIGQELVINS